MSSNPELLGLPIRAAAAAVRAGDLSAVDLTQAGLARIAALDPRLHAMVETCPTAAMAAAAAIDAQRAAGAALPPLAGVPIVVKDIVDVAGMPTRCGSVTRHDAPAATVDAPVVARLRAAGAIILGKSVTQEFAAGTISPPARNPWDPTRIPGGSSGGSAVAVGTGMALAGVGSDTGGSIRNPAAICGVSGLKPTFGAVPTTGVFPLAWSLDTVGPLARTVDDAWLTYAAMRGEDDAPELRPVIAGRRIGLLGGYFAERIAPDVATAVTAAAAALQASGALVLDVEWEEAAAARAVAFVVNRVETVAVHRELLAPGNSGLTLLNPALRMRLVAGRFVPATDYLAALGARHEIKRGIAALFRRARLDAVIAPTSPVTALPAAHPFAVLDEVEEDANLAYTRLTQPFNTTGQPVLSVTCGFDQLGLPVGLQIAGRPGDERTLCEIGHAYQLGTRWLERLPTVIAAHLPAKLRGC